MKSIRLALMILFAAVTDLACGGSDGGGGNAAAEGGPPPTWTELYADVVSPTCAVPCHNPNGIGFQMGKLDMSTRGSAYTNLVNVASAGVACAGKGIRVVPGSPGSSILFLKADHTDPAPCGSKMPLGSSGLPESQSDELEAWIAAGAMDD